MGAGAYQAGEATGTGARTGDRIAIVSQVAEGAGPLGPPETEATPARRVTAGGPTSASGPARRKARPKEPSRGTRTRTAAAVLVVGSAAGAAAGATREAIPRPRAASAVRGVVRPAASALAEAECGAGDGAPPAVVLVVGSAGEARRGAASSVEAVGQVRLKPRVATEADVARPVEGGVIVASRKAASAQGAASVVGTASRPVGEGPAYAARTAGSVAPVPVPGG